MIDRLIKRRILEGEAGGFLSLTRWVARAGRYPRVSGPASREVEGRIMGILFAEDVPEPRDAMLIALFDACGIFDRVLSPEERANVADRIDLLGRLDLIGRSVSDAIRTADIRGPAPSPERAKSTSTREARAKALAQIPMARGLPVLGNGLSLVTEFLFFLTRQYRQLGPVFRIRTPFDTYTVLAGTEANKFLQRKGRLYLRSFDSFRPLAQRLGAHRVVVNMDGSEHFRIRKALSNGYSKSVILARLADATRIADDAVSAWPQGKAFSALPALRTIMTEQTSQLCTGTSALEWIDDLTYYVDRVLRLCSNSIPESLLRTPRFRRARDRANQLAMTILNAHDPELRAGMEPDLIDDLLQLHRADPQFLPENDLRWASLGPFLAGLHTAANVAGFMLYALIKDPDGQAAMRAEADQLFAGEGPTPEKLRMMDVTHRFAMETLRLHPVAPVALRDVVNSFEFAGYKIPVGSQLMVAFAVPHYCAEYYPDPMRFDIDRYLPERNEHRAPNVWAPFGLGTHRCLGNGFAEVQIALTISVVLHRVHIALDRPDFELKPKHFPVSSPGDASRSESHTGAEGEGPRLSDSTRKTPHLFATATLGVWARLIREHGGVPPRHWGRLAGILATSVATAPLRVAERLRYGRLVARTAIDHAPVFIQGFARSGTTHLHNLMGHDPDLGYVSTLHAITSPFFLTSRGWLEPIIDKRLPAKRPVDDVALALDLPQEEEVAVAALTHLSSAHVLTFPGRARAIMERMGSMRLGPADMADWERKYLQVLRKATLVFEGRRLVLKTPANLGRTPVLLRLFPDAKFVFIVRDPYDVFASNMKLYRKMLPLQQLHEVDWHELRNWVLSNYVDLTRRYLRDREAIPKGNLIEVRFEDLEREPLVWLERIYAALDLPGWEEARRPIADYLGTLVGYRKDRYEIDRDTIDVISREWGFAFEKWGYERRELAGAPEVPAGV